MVSAILGAVSLGNELDDLGLPRCEQSGGRVLAVVGRSEVATHEGAECVGVDEGLAAESSPAGFDDVLVHLTHVTAFLLAELRDESDAQSALAPSMAAVRPSTVPAVRVAGRITRCHVS